MDTSDSFLRIWTAFDTGQILPACAWCGRVRIDETWLLPSPAVLAAVDRRYTFSHSICDACAKDYAPAVTQRRRRTMRAKLLHEAGSIDKGALVEIGGKKGVNDERGPEDCGGSSTTSAPVYAVTGEDGQTEVVDTRDLQIVR
jgi:hypothetical protein